MNEIDLFITRYLQKRTLLHKALWLLETGGSKDAADLASGLEVELRELFRNREIRDLLLRSAPLAKGTEQRQITILLRKFTEYDIRKELVEETIDREMRLLRSYIEFCPIVNGTPLTENDIRTELRDASDIERRKQVWEASKEIGNVLAPQIIPLVDLRNRTAREAGYPNYFRMQLELREIEEDRLFSLFDEYTRRSETPYDAALSEIVETLESRFPGQALAPWSWSDPFCQEDPLDTKDLDRLFENVDLVAVATEFYRERGWDVRSILQASDLYERDGKNRHAFCINIDGEKDVRTLNNLRPTIKWGETLLHELGHAVYELGFADDTPKFLREPPHMIATEAIALWAGRHAYRKEFLRSLPSYSKEQEPLLEKAEKSLHRRQLIFGRFALVMTHFEKELYTDPTKDLQGLWQSLVQEYQKIAFPKDRKGHNDWAAKYHIGLSPVYYYSYLQGEMLASSLEETLLAGKTGTEIGKTLDRELFAKGNTLSLNDLITLVTKAPLNPEAWFRQYGVFS